MTDVRPPPFFGTPGAIRNERAAPSPVAGATPNELAASGPSSSAYRDWREAHAAATEAQRAELERLAREQHAREVEERHQRAVTETDRFDLVLPAFERWIGWLDTHQPSPLARAPSLAAQLGSALGAGAGLYLARARPIVDVLVFAGLGAVLGGGVGYGVGRVAQAAIRSASRPPANPTIPPLVERGLVRVIGLDAPLWRKDALRASWTQLAHHYNATFGLAHIGIGDMASLVSFVGGKNSAYARP